MTTFAVLSTNESGASSRTDINANFALCQKLNVDALSTISSTVAVSSSYQIYLGNASVNSITFTLPAAASSTGLWFIFKKIDGSVNPVIIDGNGSETIDGALTKTLSVAYASITVYCTGTAWYILS